MAEFSIGRRFSIQRRAFLAATFLPAALAVSGCLTRPVATAPKILFVCQAGTAKSAIAREILKRRAKERGIDVSVLSRGIAVADHVSPQLKANLLADGIDTTTEPATALTAADWMGADILVYFNPLPASVMHLDKRDWGDVPSVNDDYSNARMLMNKRIDALLNEITNRK